MASIDDDDDDDDHFLADIAAYLDASQADWSADADADADADALLLGDSRAPNPYAHANEPQISGKKSASRNATRERRQRELRELRAQCAELEARVADLQHRRQRQCGGNRSPTEQLLFAAWQQIVRRQLVMRVEAECENERLRETVAQHVAIAQSLQTSAAALSSAVAAMLPTPQPTRVAMQPFTHVDGSDAEIFEWLLAGVDNEYARMDRVLAENGLIHWRVASRTATAQMKARPGSPAAAVYIEQLEADALPFDVETVFKASWQCWQRRKLPKSSTLYERLSVADDGDSGATVLAKLRYEVVLGGEGVALDFYCAVKAYAGGGRRSYVMRGITKADALFPGIYIDETDWYLVTPLAAPGDATATFTCSHLEPKKCAGAADVRDAHASPLTTLTVTTYVADMNELNSMMMTALLGDASERSRDHPGGGDAKVAYVRQVQ